MALAAAELAQDRGTIQIPAFRPTNKLHRTSTIIVIC